MYSMTLKELRNTLEYRKKGLAYTMWKQAMLTTLGINDLFKDKKIARSIFPASPQDACPELYPPKPSIKIKTPLNKNYKERS